MYSVHQKLDLPFRAMCAIRCNVVSLDVRSKIIGICKSGSPRDCIKRRYTRDRVTRIIPLGLPETIRASFVRRMKNCDEWQRNIFAIISDHCDLFRYNERVYFSNFYIKTSSVSRNANNPYRFRGLPNKTRTLSIVSNSKKFGIPPASIRDRRLFEESRERAILPDIEPSFGCK